MPKKGTVTTRTPDPWFAEDKYDLYGEPCKWLYAIHPEVGPVSHAEVRAGCKEAEELGNVGANTRLLVAAPKLLRALENLMKAEENARDGEFESSDILILESAMMLAEQTIKEVKGGE